MNAHERLRGTIHPTAENLPLRVERYLWIKRQREAGATWPEIANGLCIGVPLAGSIMRRGDPSKPEAGRTDDITIAATPWDRDGERPALDPRLTMAKVVSPPRLTVAEMFIAALRAELAQVRASA